MKTMLMSFVGPRQETTGTAFSNYLTFEVENFEERFFQTLRNEAAKLLSVTFEERFFQTLRNEAARLLSVTFEERFFQTLRNEAAKLVSLSFTEYGKGKGLQPQQPKLSRSFSTTSKYVPQPLSRNTS